MVKCAVFVHMCVRMRVCVYWGSVPGIGVPDYGNGTDGAESEDEPGDKRWINERMELCTLPKELVTDWLWVTVRVWTCARVRARVCAYPRRCEQLTNFLSGPIRWREFGPHMWKPARGNRMLISGCINRLFVYLNMCVCSFAYPFWLYQRMTKLPETYADLMSYYFPLPHLYIWIQLLKRR